MNADAGPGSRGVVIAQFADESGAHMAAARLASEDIDAVVLDSRGPHGMGVRRAALAVAEFDVGRAVAILKTTPAAPFLLG